MSLIFSELNKNAMYSREQARSLSELQCEEACGEQMAAGDRRTMNQWNRKGSVNLNKACDITAASPAKIHLRADENHRNQFQREQTEVNDKTILQFEG
jgi:hypothetical protein